MISLRYNIDGVFVYNPDDWVTLRKTHRIIGELVGNASSAAKLPLKLLPEEALLLLENNIARIWKENDVKSSSDDTSTKNSFEESLFLEQKVIYKEGRKRELEGFKDKIVNAKRKKGDTRSTEEILEGELERTCKVTKTNLIWPILNEPLDSTIDNEEVLKKDIISHTTDLKCKVFRDLWQRGYYITTGFKFGGDYLVYLGDPVAYHAIFIVRCVEDPKDCINATEIVAFGRLGTSVKKRAVLAGVKEDGSISYITINWIDA